MLQVLLNVPTGPGHNPLSLPPDIAAPRSPRDLHTGLTTSTQTARSRAMLTASEEALRWVMAPLSPGGTF